MRYIKINRLSLQYKMYQRRKPNKYNKGSINQKINSQRSNIKKIKCDSLLISED